MAWIGMLLAATLAGQDGAGPAQAAQASEAAKAAPAKADKPKKVCVDETQMGSLFKTRICATPEEWERRRERDQAAMSKRGGETPACSGPGC